MGMDPEVVDSPADLAVALQYLREAVGLSLADIAKAATRLPRTGARARALPRSTVSDILTGKSMPSPETLTAFLSVCGVPGEDLSRWLAARERAATGHLRRPADAVRARDARARLLGVHAAIRVPGAAGELPAYVPRDLDAELHAAVAAAAERGGFVLLVGGSSVGKTRSLFEAVRAVLPQWWLVHPADPAAVRGLAGGASPPRTVVWLDELHRYLDQDGGVPAGVLRGLMTAGSVAVATLWPHDYSTRVAPRSPGGPDLYANDRSLLGLAHVIDVPADFSAAERARAKRRGADDERITIALASPEAGFTQVLAAGPELVRWWEQATDPYGETVITAAVDIRRVGAQRPIDRELLAVAAPAYLSATAQATAPPDWLDQAIVYATTPLLGASSALHPVPGGLGRVAGYGVADYLHHHGRQRRRTMPLPEPVWRALADRCHPDEVIRLARSARLRMRSEAAERMYWRAVTAGDPALVWSQPTPLRPGEVRAIKLSWVFDFVGLLAQRGAADELRRLASSGVREAALCLPRVLAARGDVAQLSRLAADDVAASAELAKVLAAQGRLDDLRRRARDGDHPAAFHLVEALAARGAAEELRQRASGGDAHAAGQLVEFLLARGLTEEAMTLCREHADAEIRTKGSVSAPYERDESKTSFSYGSAAFFANRLADLLVAAGRLDELRRRADGGDGFCARRLARVLADQGAIDELRERAARWSGNGDRRETADARCVYAGAGHRHAGDWHAANRLVEVLAAQERIDELRPLAEAGAVNAAWQLMRLLGTHGHLDELRRRLDAGDRGALIPLVRALATRDRAGEGMSLLRQEVAHGYLEALRPLAEILAQQGQADEAVGVLRRYATGREKVAQWLADFLAQHDRLDQLRELADAGDKPAARKLVMVLAAQRRIEELQAEVHAGTLGAANYLIAMGQTPTNTLMAAQIATSTRPVAGNGPYPGNESGGVLP